jgi:hypothetical protein
MLLRCGRGEYDLLVVRGHQLRRSDFDGCGTVGGQEQGRWTVPGGNEIVWVLALGTCGGCVLVLFLFRLGLPIVIARLTICNRKVIM